MENLNWDILLHELENGKCILCIGADVFTQAGDARVETQLATILQQKSAALGIRVYDDGWFHYLNNRDELGTWFTIKNFYSDQLPVAAQAIFQDIAALPFHLILNFSPDNALYKAFRAIGKPADFSCLYKKPVQNKPPLPTQLTKDKPLIFNMLGEVDEKDSLVFSYDDMFDYMKAIFEDKKMPHLVQDNIRIATHFLFIGVPTDKWYFHMFMRFLNMHLEHSKSKRFSASESLGEKDKQEANEMYSTTFISDKIPEFIKTLKNKHAEAEARKKGIENTPLSIFDRWRQWVATGEDVAMRQVFKAIKEHDLYKNDSQTRNMYLLLEMQWAGFQTIAFETEMSKNAMKTQITKGILGLIDEFEANSLSNVQ